MISNVYLSGEGASDLGSCVSYNSHDGSCDADRFKIGPMAALLVKQLKELNCKGVSWVADLLGGHSDAINFVYFDRNVLRDYVEDNGLKRHNKFRPSSSTPKGFAADAMRAYALGLLAGGHNADMAVVFHDVDGTRSELQQCPRRYEELRGAIKLGFEASNFPYGVAMVPRPKQEAWLVCAAEEYANAYYCENTLSGNDRAPKTAAKVVLADRLKVDEASTEIQFNFVMNHVEPSKLRCMPSYNDFCNDLESAVHLRFNI